MSLRPGLRAHTVPCACKLVHMLRGAGSGRVACDSEVSQSACDGPLVSADAHGGLVQAEPTHEPVPPGRPDGSAAVSLIASPVTVICRHLLTHAKFATVLAHTHTHTHTHTISHAGTSTTPTSSASSRCSTSWATTKSTYCACMMCRAKARCVPRHRTLYHTYI
jgi:hypothetical protein